MSSRLAFLSPLLYSRAFERALACYFALALCLAPQERLYHAGEWIEGLWPEVGAAPEMNGAWAAAEILASSDRSSTSGGLWSKW